MNVRRYIKATGKKWRVLARIVVTAFAQSRAGRADMALNTLRRYHRVMHTV